MLDKGVSCSKAEGYGRWSLRSRLFREGRPCHVVFTRCTLPVPSMPAASRSLSLHGEKALFVIGRKVFPGSAKILWSAAPDDVVSSHTPFWHKGGSSTSSACGPLHTDLSRGTRVLLFLRQSQRGSANGISTDPQKTVKIRAVTVCGNSTKWRVNTGLNTS